MPTHDYIETKSWTSAKTREKALADMFRKVASDMNDDNLPGVQCFRGKIGARRQRAILNNIDAAVSKFGSFGLICTEETFCEIETFASGLFNRYSWESIQTGAAKWILDKLMIAGRSSDAMDILPYADSAKESTGDYLPPKLIHPAHTTDTIAAVLHAIMWRHNEGNVKCLFTNGVARGEKPSETYARLIGLLPREDIEKACETFRSKLWEIAARTMKARAVYQRRITDVMTASGKGPDRFPGDTGLTPDEEDVIRSIKREEVLVCCPAPYFQMDRQSIVEELGSKQVAAALAGFAVDDPFELCFALIYLLDSGSDDPWLIGSCECLMLFVIAMLPWDEKILCEGSLFEYNEDLGGYEVGFDDDELDGDYDREIDDESFLTRNDWQKDGPVPDELDLYNTKHGGLNLSQIIYDLSGGVIPVGVHPFEKDRLQLISEGMDERTARKVTDIAETIFYQRIQNRSMVDVRNKLTDDKLADEEAEIEQEDDKVDLVAENMALRSENDDLGKQLKSMRAALVLTEQEAKKEKARYERELESLRMEHRELADLREIVFHSDLSDGERERNEAPEKSYSYPYATNKRTVIFGGHDSFVSAMRPKLSNVRFVDKRLVNFDPKIVRKADVVWIQTNSMSHKQYWNVAKYCKQNGTQLRYFGFAGVEKCIEQLIEWDKC